MTVAVPRVRAGIDNGLSPAPDRVLEPLRSDMSERRDGGCGVQLDEDARPDDATLMPERFGNWSLGTVVARFAGSCAPIGYLDLTPSSIAMGRRCRGLSRWRPSDSSPQKA